MSSFVYTWISIICSVDNIHGIKFKQGSRRDFQHVGGHYIITPAEKVTFQRWKSDSRLLKSDPRHIWTVGMWPGVNFQRYTGNPLGYHTPRQGTTYIPYNQLIAKIGTNDQVPLLIQDTSNYWQRGKNKEVQILCQILRNRREAVEFIFWSLMTIFLVHAAFLISSAPPMHVPSMNTRGICKKKNKGHMFKFPKPMSNW